MSDKKLHDNELGTILLRVGSRNKRYTIKISNGMITATMPPHGNERTMLDFIEMNRAKLIQALNKHPKRPMLNDMMDRQMTTFRLRIIRADRINFGIKLKDGILTISCPQQTNFEDERVQQLLIKSIQHVCRHEAKRLLPTRTMQFAQKHGFTCTAVKINSSKTHWGSCTRRKSINLSLSLMQLPWHLIDYVLLHELCHTVEMNHSKRFWELMDKVTDNKALSLRKELKEHNIFLK